MKKFVIIFLSGLLYVGTIIAQQSGFDDPISWELTDGTLVISGEGAMPDYSESYDFGDIVGAPWRHWNEGITNVVICEGVTHIGDYAFYKLINLNTVAIPASVASIGDYAFGDCDNITQIVNASISPQVIPASAFTILNTKSCILMVYAGSVDDYNNNDEWKKYNIMAIPEGTTGLLSWELINGTLIISGDGAMPDYTSSFVPWNVHKSSITSVKINFGVTSIGNNAFFGCTGLKSIIIPESVTSIGEYAFNNCPSLSSVVFPESLNNISDWAFVGCSGLTSVIIPVSVTFVSSSAFEECSRLISITVDPANPYYSSEDDVLFSKDGTTLVTFPGGRSGNYFIPESVTSIDDWAFSFCIGLTSVVFPESLTSIGTSSFYGCSALSSIIIPDMVTSIGEYAFGACTGLTSVVIPASLTSINNTAFYRCDNLSEIINMSPTPQMITAGTFDSSIFPDCILRVHIGSVDDYNDSAIWQDFTIEAFSNGTTGLLTWEFANGTLFISGEGEMPDYYNENIQPWHEWKNLVTGVDIGEGITVIGSNAFHGYDRITSVSISGTVETIKSGAFIYNNFTSVTIPASVTSIDPMAMTGCFALTSITVDGANPNYTSVDGALYDKEKTTLITFPIGREGAYSIPEPVEIIGSFSFCYGNLNSITIPASVKTIGEYAFYRTGITSIFIPELVANIGNEALAGCAQ